VCVYCSVYRLLIILILIRGLFRSHTEIRVNYIRVATHKKRKNLLKILTIFKRSLNYLFIFFFVILFSFFNMDALNWGHKIHL